MHLVDIKKVRIKKGISRYKLAKIAGLKQSTIQNIEEGIVINPGIFTVMKIFVALNLNINSLEEE